MKKFWEERFGGSEYIYGRVPNYFVKEQIEMMKPGRGLFPAEGEGRNAVYAARMNWECECYDYSEEARKKALKLANENNVRIQYHIADLEHAEFPENYYDALFMTFLHLAPEIRYQVHQKFVGALKKGGFLVAEVFDKKQLPLSSGGPKHQDMLYTPEMMREDFHNMRIITNESELRYLEEGKHHNGKAHTIRFVAQKI